MKEFIKKHNIDFTLNPIPQDVSVNEILNAYKSNNLFVLEAFSKSPNFKEAFLTGLNVHFFSNEAFIEQSYELAQFTVKQIEKCNYPANQMKMALMILKNKDKRAKCFLFEKFLLGDDIHWNNKEFAHIFQLVMNHTNWQFNLELFSLNINFDKKIMNSTHNALNLLLLASSKKALYEKVEFLINEKGVFWQEIEELRPSFNHFMKSNKIMSGKKLDEDKTLENLKILSILPKIDTINNIVSLFQEQVNLLSFQNEGEKKANLLLSQLEEKILSNKIETAQHKNIKKIKI